MTPVEPVHIEAVRFRPGCEWHHEYRRLRHRIFVVEQGWTGLSCEKEHGVTRKDPTDDRASFWLAWSASGPLIGAVRVCAVADAFPHKELFAHHLERPEVRAALPTMGTFNSLVVARDWRGRPCEGRDGRISTAASQLLRASLLGSADAGLYALVATAQSVISARAFMRAGFRVIDPPAQTPLHARFPMCNVGIVLRSPGPDLSRYFDRCQQRVLGSKTIDDWYACPAAAIAGAARRQVSPAVQDFQPPPF